MQFIFRSLGLREGKRRQDREKRESELSKTRERYRRRQQADGLRCPPTKNTTDGRPAAVVSGWGWPRVFPSIAINRGSNEHELAGRVTSVAVSRRVGPKDRKGEERIGGEIVLLPSEQCVARAKQGGKLSTGRVRPVQEQWNRTQP